MVLSQNSGQYIPHIQRVQHTQTVSVEKIVPWGSVWDVISQYVYVNVTFISSYLQLSKCNFQHCCWYFSSGFCEPSVVILCTVKLSLTLCKLNLFSERNVTLCLDFSFVHKRVNLLLCWYVEQLLLIVISLVVLMWNFSATKQRRFPNTLNYSFKCLWCRVL